LIDNAPAHPVRDLKNEDDKIDQFLPSNAFSVIEPMDKCVVESMKGLYHNTFIKQRVYSDNEVDVKEFRKKCIACC
jgi:hypothetical protein